MMRINKSSRFGRDLLISLLSGRAERWMMLVCRHMMDVAQALTTLLAHMKLQLFVCEDVMQAATVRFLHQSRQKCWRKAFSDAALRCSREHACN